MGGWVIIIISGDEVEAYDGVIIRDYDTAYRKAKELYWSDIYPEGTVIKLLPLKIVGICDNCLALSAINKISKLCRRLNNE